MADMRLFHHFLITAYPHLPVGADRIWVTVIPSFAHNVCPFQFGSKRNFDQHHSTSFILSTCRKDIKLIVVVRISHPLHTRTSCITSRRRVNIQCRRTSDSAPHPCRQVPQQGAFRPTKDKMRTRRSHGSRSGPCLPIKPSTRRHG